MKKIFSVTLVLMICISAVSSQTTNNEKNPSGRWKFDAPYAPEGYTAGTIDIRLADQKYSATMTFTYLDYSLPGEKVTMRNDSIFFMIWVENTDVNIALKIEDNLKMSGKAVYFEGTVPLTLTKETEPQQ
jgi:hypothetical protein